MPVPTADFELFTSLRYDPKLLTSEFNTRVNKIELPYLLFQYHFDRLLAAATYFGWRSAVAQLKAPGASERLRHMCDQAVMDSVLTDKEKGLGLRVLLSRSGNIRVEAHPTRPLTRDPLLAASVNPLTTPPTHLPGPIFTVHLDTQATPVSAFTSFKTTARGHYDAARVRRGIKDRRELREVLLYNERGEVMEGSVRNVAFWRGENERGEGGGWVTPSDRSGGLAGTVRRYLLERGMMKEGTIRVSDVRVGEYVLLSNGWDGTILGHVVGD
ncbi:ABZ2 [Sanghuangporus sanghuang]